MFGIAGLTRLSVALFVVTLVVLGGSGIASAQAIEPEDIGAEMFHDGKVPAEDQPHLYQLYGRLAGELGLTVDEALAQGITLTEIGTLLDPNAESNAESKVDSIVGWTEIAPGVYEFSDEPPPGTLPTPSERGLIRMIAFGIFAALTALFRAAKTKYASAAD